MRILLRDDVENLGRKGDLVDVADGYARNFLVPRGAAIPASPGAVRQAEAMRRSREARDARERAAAEELAAKLGAGPIRVAARAGEEGRLFGSVTNMDIATAVREQVGVELDRRAIELEEPIKELGSAEVRASVHPDVDVTLAVEVVAE